MQYLVTFSVPTLTEKMLKAIPKQREAVDRLIANGIIMSYALTKNMDRLYVIFEVNDEAELKKQIYEMPLSRIMPFQFKELFFHLGAETLPAISLN